MVALYVLSLGAACGASSRAGLDDSGEGSDNASASADETVGDSGSGTDGCAMYPSVDGTYSGPFPENPSGFGGHCDPSADEDAPGLVCCSTDPTRILSTMQNGQTRVMSGDANAQSSYGQCFGGSGITLSNGCLTPCDPSANAEEQTATCGANTLCCQDRQTPMGDCVFDTEQSCFVPANETYRSTQTPANCPLEEITSRLTTVGLPLTLARCSFSDLDELATAQSPSTSFCDQLEADTNGGYDAQTCYDAQSLAHQRGVCLAISSEVQLCPLALSDQDKLANGIPLGGCRQLNIDLQYSCG